MKKRLRFLSASSKVGKSVFTVLTAYYLKSLDIPFLIEELDPFHTVGTFVDDEFEIIYYFDLNQFLYSHGNLIIDQSKLKRGYDNTIWNILISDMLTKISPEHEAIKFQNIITSNNVNVFLTELNKLEEIIEYAKMWNDGQKILVVNMVPDNQLSTVEDDIIDLVYEKGIFKATFVFPFDNKIRFLDPEKVGWFRESLPKILYLE
ncbi:hypothetical protein [Stygiolobus caldivivus]|uniref:Uncharacterized protein n=1 Tax=Stygiolobus caldivivus TaxID=2824673 RepID=A0A8D5U7I9_9CREN|nr:hypothetical protein [Stygiolobus caldivivus]BCU71006.1 hypothetical protein KN1_23030 [Stygiolobus caldivivus]